MPNQNRPRVAPLFRDLEVITRLEDACMTARERRAEAEFARLATGMARPCLRIRRRADGSTVVSLVDGPPRIKVRLRLGPDRVIERFA